MRTLEGSAGLWDGIGGSRERFGNTPLREISKLPDEEYNVFLEGTQGDDALRKRILKPGVISRRHIRNDADEELTPSYENLTGIPDELSSFIDFLQSTDIDGGQFQQVEASNVYDIFVNSFPIEGAPFIESPHLHVDGGDF